MEFLDSGGAPNGVVIPYREPVAILTRGFQNEGSGLEFEGFPLSVGLMTTAITPGSLNFGFGKVLVFDFRDRTKLYAGLTCAAAALEESFVFITNAYAQAPGGFPGGDLMTFLPMIAIFVVFYFLLIRPQQKRAKETRAMLEALPELRPLLAALEAAGLDDAVWWSWAATPPTTRASSARGRMRAAARASRERRSHHSRNRRISFLVKRWWSAKALEISTTAPSCRTPSSKLSGRAMPLIAPTCRPLR
jgi:hypothetical protein